MTCGACTTEGCRRYNSPTNTLTPLTRAAHSRTVAITLSGPVHTRDQRHSTDWKAVTQVRSRVTEDERKQALCTMFWVTRGNLCGIRLENSVSEERDLGGIWFGEAILRMTQRERTEGARARELELVSSRAHQKEAAEALRIDLSVSGCGDAPPPRHGRLRNPRAGSSPSSPGVRLIGLLPSLRRVVVEESRIESVADWWPSESSLVGSDPAEVPE